MSKETSGIGLNVSVIVENVPISFEVAYDSTSLSMEVESCKLDVVKTANERFNNLNVVLPEGASPLTIAKFSGSVGKTDQHKQPQPDGKYRLFRFDGEMENIEIPIPIVSDIRIDKAFFSYQYHSAASKGTGDDFKDQIVFLGCKLSVKPGTKLDTYLTGATLTGAYFLSNNATIIYFDFSGTINLGNIIDALFGFPATSLEMDVASAGLFRIAKTNKSTNKGPLPSKDTGLSYLDALKQIANLQGSSTGKTENSSVSSLMPASFPLKEEIKIVDNVKTSKFGIKNNNKVDFDFIEQFERAFASDDVTGICFWAMVDFNNSPLFGSLNTIGYDSQKVNSLLLYGFNTHSGSDKTKKSSTYFFAQLPCIRLFDTLELGGTQGRDGILFKYSSEKKEFELNGSIAFNAFDKDFLFEGDLVVNDLRLKAELDVVMGHQSSIDAPLGMKGICFGELFFSIDNTFAKKNPVVASRLNLAIGGLIQLQLKNTRLQLCGNIVFDNSEIRLVLVAIEASNRLLLSDFVCGVLKLDWEWLDDFTSQFGFISGSMYYLSPPENAKNNKNYSFSYDNPIQVKTTNLPAKPIQYKQTSIYKSGYHIHADLFFFEEYAFAIDLSVEEGGIRLSGVYTGKYVEDILGNYIILPNATITAYFISFESPSLTICTIGDNSFELGIDNIKIFNTNLGSIKVKYSKGCFIGSYLKEKMGFGFEWKWSTKKDSSGGFSITKINGIDGKDMDILDQLKKMLNNLNKGGCAAVTKSMFKDLKSSFAPSLQEGKSPIEKGNGIMCVPLCIVYTLTKGKKEKDVLITDKINMDLDVTIPNSAEELPKALFSTIFDNLDNVAEAMLTNEAIYIALAVEMSKKGGMELASKMLCRKVKTKSGIKLAEALEAVMEAGMLLEDVGIMLEMEGLLYAMGFIGVAVAAIAFAALIYKIWDSANSNFNSEEDKKKAQEQLDIFKDSMLKKLQTIYARMDRVAASIKLEKLEASINEKGEYQLQWSFPDNRALGVTDDLSYQLVFLHGSVGENTPSISPIPATSFETMKVMNRQFTWAEMRQLDPDFQMNASIQTSVTGTQYLGDDTGSLQETVESIKKTIQMFDMIGDALVGAREFNNQLKKFNNDMQEYMDHGIRSKIVYATTNNEFTIGQSALGVNTKI